MLLLIIVILVMTNIVTVVMMSGNESLTGIEGNYTVEVDKKEPVAKIGGDPVSYQEWLHHLEKTYGKKALTEMIDYQVVEQLAAENNISIREEVIDLEISFLLTMAGPLTVSETEAKEAKWRETINHRLLTEELFTQNINISDVEIQSYYDQYKNQYNFSQQIQISHVILPDQATADRVIAELEDGASFSALAREYTTDEETKRAGGYLGYYTASNSFLPTGYFDRAIALAEEQYSEPFSVNAGVAILYLHRELPSVDLTFEQLSSHIRRKIAIEEMGEVPSARALWEQLDVEWIYQ